jgi:H+/Cl- antiporter ClcA
MLPLDERWYRRLLLVALGLGAAGGVFALAYSLATNGGIGLFFGEPSAEPFSGEWWWVPLVAAGALLVAFLRERTGVSGPIPGAVAFAREGWVDPRTALQLVLISAISLMVGASLGPSFGIIVSAGGFAAWLISRRQDATEDERQEHALVGMAGGLGAVFSAPLFASVMASELSPTPKRAYVTAFVPQFSAAIVGFVIFYGVSGKVMLDSFNVPDYEFEYWHLIGSLALGLGSALLAVAYVAIGRVVQTAGEIISNRYARAALFGGIVGLIAFGLPLTATGGSAQLSYETANLSTLSTGLLIAVLVAKIFAIALSQQAGFLGGAVFPMLFLGGTGGAIVSAIVPDVPVSLAVASMIAAVPGAIIGAPVSFILIGTGTTGLGVEAIPPIGVAVVSAHISVSALQLRRRPET